MTLCTESSITCLLYTSGRTGNLACWTREYSSEWKLGDEPYYPVNDAKSSALYEQYKALAEAEDNGIFGGRLGEYKYYDMDKTVEVALAAAKKELP